MIYRFGTLEDCPQIYELICQLEDTQLPYARFSRIWETQVGSPDHVSLVCEEDGMLLGVLNLRFEDQLHHADTMAEIMELAVRSGSRSRGIGKALITWAYEVAREKGCLQIEVSCNQSRVHAHRFYLREGMENHHFKFSHKL